MNPEASKVKGFKGGKIQMNEMTPSNSDTCKFLFLVAWKNSVLNKNGSGQTFAVA